MPSGGVCIPLSMPGWDKAGNQLNGLAARFVGLQAAIGYVQQGLQMMLKYMGESVQKFREFQKRIAEVGTILGNDVYPQIERLSSGVEILAIQFGQATSDMAKGLYDILSAAFEAEDALNLLSVATKASIAGLSTVRDSVDIFTTVMNSYGMSVTEATHVSDTLFQSVVRGKFQFRDLESSLGYVVPIAAQAGIEFDELMAALSTATRHGLHLDMTSRGLALAIQNIINPTEKAQKAAQQYGIDMSSLSLRIHGLQGFFANLNEATKEFGSTIISELIPNMRSLRVAMVLAGEEGLEGFEEDLNLVRDAAGRTNEALNKIASTDEFVANRMQQSHERIDRAIGKTTSKWDLALKGLDAWGKANLESVFSGKANVEIFNNWEKIFGTLDNTIEKNVVSLSKMEQASIYAKTVIEAETLSEKKHKAALEENWNAVEKYGTEIDILNRKISASSNAFNEIVSPIDKAQRKLESLEITLGDIDNDLERLNDELTKSIKYGWGDYQKTIEGTLNYELELLKAEQKHTDIIHDVNMGMEDAGYIWKTNNQTLQNHVAILRDWEKMQERNRKQTELMNVALRENNLQIMILQLKGMKRRRGLTRSEERQIKKLQIANMEIRIDTQQTQEAITKAKVDSYWTSKEYVDKSIRDANEVVYQMKYNYDQQIYDLEQTIISESDLLAQRKDEWTDTWNDINKTAYDKIALLSKIITENPVLAKFIDASGMKTALSNWLNKFQNETMSTLSSYTGSNMAQGSYYWQEGGTYYGNKRVGGYDLRVVSPTRGGMEDLLSRQRGGMIPSTGLYVMHKGENVSPRGSESHGGNITINVNTHVANVSSDVDVNKIARTNARIIAAELGGRYGMR